MNFQVGEFHAFSGGGRRFLYTVPSAGIFELDDTSAAVLALLTEKPATQEQLLAIADLEKSHLAATGGASGHN